MEPLRKTCAKNNEDPLAAPLNESSNTTHSDTQQSEDPGQDLQEMAGLPRLVHESLASALLGYRSAYRSVTGAGPVFNQLDAYQA